VVLSHRFLGLALEVLEGGGEIIIARRGKFGGGNFRCFDRRSVVLRSVFFRSVVRRRVRGGR